MSESEDLTFPDPPRLELDTALASLVEHAERVQAAQGRLRALLRATQTIVGESDLPTVLLRIVESARELVGAEYGALGVIAPDGDHLEQFIHVGLEDDVARRIGRLPSGRGLLGALIADPRPIRLERMEEDVRAVGFPPHHPTMRSFLGVPLTVRDEAFGSLYLTDRRGGAFTEEDEQLLTALAATGGFAVQNARLLAEARTRADWMATSAELAGALLSTPPGMALDLVAGRIECLPGVDQVTILVPDEDDTHVLVAAARGDQEAVLRKRALGSDSIAAADVLLDGRPRALPRQETDVDDPTRIAQNGATGALVVVPLRTGASVWGAICVARDPGRPSFNSIELETAADLASRVSISIELARAREEQQRTILADERRRIARDLHDHVIQQLFGTGLSLQALAGRLASSSDRAGIDAAVAQVDDAISQIRTVVFALSRHDDESVRHRVIDVVAELSSTLRRPPSIRFTGPVDHSLNGQLAEDVIGVVSELLANVVRHARADLIAVEVGVADGQSFVRVHDDGVGISAPSRVSGLANLAQRADARGGSFTYGSDDAGTTTYWRVPLSSGDPLTPGGMP